jgi:hypothetical protein
MASKKRKREETQSASDNDDDDFDPRELAAMMEMQAENAGAADDDEDEGADGAGSGKEPKAKRARVDNKVCAPLHALPAVPVHLTFRVQVAMTAKLAEFALPREWPWIEKIDVTAQPLELENVHDDLKREATLYACCFAPSVYSLLRFGTATSAACMA